ncbi:MAG: MAPEG family protein [Deltaproteobacteria bacterium]|nr:MAPEG family protein [Deltaproteobacteria bacterium]
MALVAVVTILALVQYFLQGVRVGMARGKYGVEAPATTGHPVFERHFRVHQNTLEQMIVFLPSLWLFAQFVSPRIAALLGVVFLVARFLYERGYVEDPKKRSTGAGLTAAVNGILVLGAVIGALWQLL